MRCRLRAITTLAIVLLKAQAAQDVPTEIPFQFSEGLLWVKVSIPKSPEHLHFLLDTGAGASVISRSTAERLGLKFGSEVTVRGVEKSLLGADFFRGRAIQIDFRAQKLRVLQSLPGSGEILPLELRPCGMRVPITVNGHKRQWVRLDTGCASALQWVTSRVRPQECKPHIAIGLAEVSIPQTKTTVEIGQQKFANVPTGLHENAIFAGEAGLLGNGLLARFARVTIDAKSGRLILETDHPAR